MANGRPTLVLPQQCSSPVGVLLPMVAQAPANIAPEQIAPLRREIADLRIEIPEDAKWIFRYEPAAHAMVLSTGAVEICWAATHGYVTFYDRILVNRTVDLQREVDLTSDPEVHGAMRLLTWAFRKFVGGKHTPWPKDLRRPDASPAHGSPEHVANELALCVLGFLMHHEIAHHRLRHGVPDNDDSWILEQEREADHAAADRIMEGALDDTEARRKRLYGIAVALSLLVAHGIHSGRYGGLKHPRSFDRLLSTLDRFIHDEPDHNAWALAVGILALHLQSKGIAFPAHSAQESYRGLVEAIVEALALVASGTDAFNLPQPT